MPKGTAGSYFGKAPANLDLIPIFRENELKKHPDSFLKTSALIIKKLAIAAPAGTVFKINSVDFLMPSNSFELSFGMIDIKKLKFKNDLNVSLTMLFQLMK